ncbi:thiamine-phosphate kinase [uncultured Cohaesibacter sp.]|uniref:thiamine-phosphate kinase n=1 Tax=uncultured Cohaesibacter sp. TaxID=1002546 RepID=UPI0029C905FD|nr:thiamine-phosphate kinase [uncultured Cohaesibacter sp.]
MADKTGRPSESTLIEQYFAPLSDPDSSFGLTDDAAFLSIPDDRQLVVTKDMLVADIHFFRDDQASHIAKKALRVNLSDLAAKAATPLGYMLGLGLPSDWQESWLADFCAGLKADQEEFGFPLIGGDTVKNPERLTLSVTAFGTVAKGRMIVRPRARVGDDVYVTGTIGDSALGLLIQKGGLPEGISKADLDWLKDRFLLPQPRITCAPLLLEVANAAMDISDGLVGDAAKMARAANVCVEITETAIPLSLAARNVLAKDQNLFERVLFGGDDYELLFTADPGQRPAIAHEAESLGVPVTRIGRIIEGAGVTCINADGGITPLAKKASFEHF